MIDIPRVLFIEDDSKWRNQVKGLLESPPASWRADMSLDRFQVETAGWVEQAKELLIRQEDTDRYDVVLLDLGLPSTRQEFDDGAAEDQNGCDLLTWINDMYDVAVIVLTGNPGRSLNLLHALRKGAMDFVGRTETLVDQGRSFLTLLVQAVGKTRRARFQEGRISRVRWLGNRKERQDLARVRNCVSTELDRSCLQLDHLSDLLMHEYGLNAEDAVGRELSGLKESLRGLPAMLWNLFPSDAQAATYESIDLAEEISKRLAALRPCYVYCGLEHNWDPSKAKPMRIKTFKEDLAFLLDEMLFDPLETAPTGSAVEIECRKSKDENDILLQITRPWASRTKHPGSGQSVETESPEADGLQLLKGVAHNMSAGFDWKLEGESITLTLTLHVMDHG